MQHKSGHKKDSYTFHRRPVDLVWFASFTRVEQAIEQEKRIKKWSHAKKRALIAADWDRVEELAKKRFK